MNIVLDTNIISYGDWYLEGPIFTLLEKFLRLSGVKLFVPEIVVLEVKNSFKKTLTKSFKSLDENMPTLRRLLPNEDVLRIPDIVEKCREYDTKLDKRLAELKAERPGHSDIPHDKIVSRVLTPRKPCTGENKGYRDSLLWEVILRKIVTKDTTTFFISKNYTDFTINATDKTLHPELLDDLAAAGLPKDVVQFYSDLRSFVDEQVKSKLEAIVDDIVRSLEKGSYKGFSVKKWFVENQEAIKDQVNDKIERAFSHIANELEDPTVTCIEDPERIDIDEVARYERDEQLYYIGVTVFADMTIDVFVDKVAYYSYLGEKFPLEVWDSDWNEHYVWAVVQVKLPLSLFMLFDASEETVESFEVDDVGEFWGWCRDCGAQIMSDAAEECWSCGKSFG